MNKDRPRILIVDDQAQNRMLFIEYLSELEVDVDEASSGEECLRILKNNIYSLVCLDVQMPVLDGYQVLEKMREDNNLADVPVIFISAVFNSEEYILKGLSKGAIDYIIKPVSIPILINKVSNFLKLYEKQKKLDLLVNRLENMNHRIRENKQKFKRITNSAKDSIIVLDNQFNIRFLNRAANTTFGYNKFEIIYENFFELLIADEARSNLKEQFTDLIQISNTELSNSIRSTGKNNLGSEFPIELSVASYTTAQEQINYTVIIRDITHRVKMEKEALAAKELRESNMVMKEFMDNVSHELRTPMNAILGISNMLIKYNSDNLTAKQQEGLEIISQSGARLLDLINDILDLSRINANREKVVNELFDFDIFLATIQSIVISLIGEKKIRFLIRKSKSVPQFINTDSKKLNQILINLLGNAAKFTSEGKILLFVHYFKNHLYFEVSDTGIGIDEQYLESIFDRFHQIDNSASKSFKGTGLGLNITKKMVELMKGEIAAESKSGKGTVMKFYIPLIGEESEKETPHEIKTSKINILDGLELSKRLAIIIDVEPETQYLFSEILKINKFNSVLCNQSNSAIAEIQKWNPDLIILRLEMPKMHGLSLIRLLKNQKNFKQIPIITYSTVEDFNPDSYDSTVKFINEPLTEKKILSNLQNINYPEDPKPAIDIVTLYEKDNHLESLKISGCEYFLNNSFESALLYISRRKINTLVFDGLDLQGQNFQLLTALNKIPAIAPQRAIAVSHKLFKPVMKELEQLPNYKIFNFSEITKITALR